jgi:glycosyltransferase involved in cell wall biosynthesis/LmbE family N-acetylglucosaminyl deacetylase
MILKKGLVTITMSVFNGQDTVAAAIDSMIAQSYQNWQLIAIDDASTDDSYKILCAYQDRDPRVKAYRNSINRGTYWNRNRAIVMGEGEFITNLDCDDQYFPDKLAVQVANIGNAGACVCHYIRDVGGIINLSSNTMLFKREVIDTLGYFDSVRYDADTEYLRRLSICFPVIQIPDILYQYTRRIGSLTEAEETGVDSKTGSARRGAYEASYRQWQRSSTFPYVNFPQVQRPFALGHESQQCPKEQIIVSMATFPERQESLKSALSSIYPWVDRINICLNEYDSVPDFLQDSKIHVDIGAPDRGDTGKFLWSNSIDGYHFTCDDDIIYSRRYFETLLTAIERYDREAIVGIHGSMVKRIPLPDFYSTKDRETVTFRQPLMADRRVDFLGTGVMAYHTQKVHIPYDLFHKKNMADVLLGIYAANQNIPLIQCASKNALVRDSEIKQTNSIYRHSSDDIPSKFNSRNQINALLAEYGWSMRRLPQADELVASPDASLSARSWVRSNMEFKASQKLMVVAHPDDESLFGGQELLRDPGWTVICLTNGDHAHRRNQFFTALERVGACGEIWAYPDMPGRSKLPDEARADWAVHISEITERLLELATQYSFAKIVTHNQLGEYGHEHHKMAHEIVTRIFPPAAIHCFGLGAPIERELLAQKIGLLDIYRDQFSDAERCKYQHWLQCATTLPYLQSFDDVGNA